MTGVSAPGTPIETNFHCVFTNDVRAAGGGVGVSSPGGLPGVGVRYTPDGAVTETLGVASRETLGVAAFCAQPTMTSKTRIVKQIFKRFISTFSLTSIKLFARRIYKENWDFGVGLCPTCCFGLICHFERSALIASPKSSPCANERFLTPFEMT